MTVSCMSSDFEKQMVFRTRRLIHFLRFKFSRSIFWVLRLMCQHFSGHKVKQLYTAIRSLLATNSRWQNVVAHGYKRPQYIQIWLSWLHHGFDRTHGAQALFSTYGRGAASI